MMRVGILMAALLAGPALAQGPRISPQTAFINDYLAKTWKANGINPSARCTSHEFVRRVYIDLIGRIPKTDEVDSFMNKMGGNRAALVQKLLYDKPYADEYANRMADLWTSWLLTRSGNATYHEQMRWWLQDQFKANTPYRDMVGQLITAKGQTNKNGAVNFILANLGEKTPRDKEGEEGHFAVVPITSRTTRLFLGLQTQCVQCHDHPFNPDWKQQNFWGVNSFFRQVARVGTPITRRNNRMEQTSILELTDDESVNKDGIVYYERRNGMILPTGLTFLDGRKAELSGSRTRREMLAEMIVSHENFPKAIVNRMWGLLFGRGMNEQPVVDDFGDHNKVVLPELLDKLAKDFATDGNYDLKALLTWICTSDAYSLSSVSTTSNAKPETDVFFSKMQLKAMTPEQLLNSLWVATQGRVPDVNDAKTIQDRREAWTKKLVTNFGDDEGNEMVFSGTVVQALLMMNGQDINKEIAAPNGVLVRAVNKYRGAQGPIVRDIYLAALSRAPSDAEAAIINRISNRYAGKIDVSFYTDVMWTVLNSHAFILNH